MGSNVMEASQRVVVEGKAVVEQHIRGYTVTDRVEALDLLLDYYKNIELLFDAAVKRALERFEYQMDAAKLLAISPRKLSYHKTRLLGGNDD
jgi:hypothetical protein